jgi:lipid A 3-O-deacylase
VICDYWTFSSASRQASLLEPPLPLRHLSRLNFFKFACVSLGLFSSISAFAEETATSSEPIQWAYGSVQVENDLFANMANTDRHYTNGLQASVLSAPLTLDGWLGNIARLRVPLGLDDSQPAETRIGVALGHSIFTPDDTQANTLITNDRPYAAWAHVTLTLQTLWETRSAGSFQDQWKFDIGIIGPAAGGRFVQNNWHNLIGADEANGWSHQLRNEPGLNVKFERAWNSPDLSPRSLGGFEVDGIPYAVAALGNIQTYLGGGGIVRFGPDLPDDFGPTRIYPGVGGSEAFTVSDKFNWYLFAGVEGRLIGHDIFLDGNLFRDSHNVNKRFLVSDLRLGAVTTWQNARLSFTHVYRTKEYSAQTKADQFGSFALGFAF